MNFTVYRTLSEATNKLRQKGFKFNFSMEGDRLKCVENGKLYEAKDLKIVEYHRFEGASSPGDMSIVFAVVCEDGTKGSIVSSYGAYGNTKLLTFMDKVKIADRSSAAAKP